MKAIGVALPTHRAIGGFVMRLMTLLTALAMLAAGTAPALAPKGSMPDITRQYAARANCHQAYDVMAETVAAKGSVTPAEAAWTKAYETAAAGGKPCPQAPETLLRRAVNRTVATGAGLNILAKFIDAKDPSAIFEAAYAVLTGKAPQVKPEIGFGLLKSAADLGDPYAQYFLAMLHIGGTFGKQDYAGGLPLIEAAAASGHVDALFQAGNFYKEGIAGKKDPRKAFDYYRQAAERGHAYAAVMAYYMVQDGEGTAKDFKLAYRLARNLADQGEVYGAVMTAGALLQQKNAVKNEDEVLYWMDVAIRDGDDRIRTEVGKFRPQVVAAFTKAKAPPQYVPRVRKACPMKTVCYVNRFTGANSSCTTNKDYWNDCDF